MKRNSLFIMSLVLFSMSAAAVETTVKGGRMELLEKGEKVLFRDNVRMERGTDVVQANEMVTTKERDRITATGNVRLFREISSTETWKGRGQKGFYNTKTGEGYLIGEKEQAHLIRTEVLSSTSTREINVLADRIDFTRDTAGAVADGRVYTKTFDPDTNNLYEFWSEHAVYDGKEKKMVLSGQTQPRVRESGSDGTKVITGDVITYRVEKKIFESDGNAVATFTDEGKTK
jgi:lipopolysaccharide transport protein LptA